MTDRKPFCHIGTRVFMLQLTGKGKIFPLLPKHKSRGGMLMLEIV
ncbi:hypothetical protein SC09_Contig25orf00332 [Bacillus subtilis]|uniref:Uncharacterized protein n=1 Tax=Bacillus subtilis TaxID=1423 RepID=A0A0D1KNR2_BACIU|nr:hypothetical protein SC09_Contig25orf00332 [Bacillus subtilis]